VHGAVRWLESNVVALAILVMLGMLLWRVWLLSSRDPYEPQALAPYWAQALERRIAHLQNAVFHVSRRLEQQMKNAATEPAMRVGGGQARMGVFRQTEQMSAEEIDRALREAAEADSRPHAPATAPADQAAPTPRRHTPPRRR
jgi:hypothetical protein